MASGLGHRGIEPWSVLVQRVQGKLPAVCATTSARTPFDLFWGAIPSSTKRVRRCQEWSPGILHGKSLLWFINLSPQPLGSHFSDGEMKLEESSGSRETGRVLKAGLWKVLIGTHSAAQPCPSPGSEPAF